MENPDLVLICDFQHRLRKLSDTSGYAFVYDALALIREFIPCREVGIDVLKPANENPDDIRLGCDSLWISNQWSGYLEQKFVEVAMHISHVKRCAQDVMQRLIAGDPLVPHTLAEEARGKPSLLDRFYTHIIQISDVADMAGLLGRYQFLESPHTRSFHVTYITIARDGGQIFDAREKQLLAVFFNLFVDHFRQKISCTGDHGFLPQYTDVKLKPRDLATLKACFDVQRGGGTVSRAAVAAMLGKTEANVDDSVKRIKKAVLKDFEGGDAGEYQRLYQEFRLQHFADVFKTYAYFGFYPPEYSAATNVHDRFTSYLSEQLGKLR